VRLRLARRVTVAGVMTAVCAVLLCAPAAHAQLPVALDTVGTRQGSVGVHLLLGGFIGRLDLAGGGETSMLGGRAGAGLGELVHLTGFYWRAFDREEGEFTADAAWGGELQFNLNTGFGIAPFVTAGLARVGLDDMPAQTAAIAGAGLTLPLGPLIAHAGARNYMFGITGLRSEGSPEDVTHNWLYSVGATIALGRGRPTRAIVAARTPAAAELAALRDSLARAAGARTAPGRSPALDEALLVLLGDTAFARMAATDTLLMRQLLASVASAADPGLRNYQSAQRIEIPLPTEGSITLRYGPEPAAPAAPVIVQQPADPDRVAAVAPQPQPQQPQFQQPPFQQPQFVVPPGQLGLTQSQFDALAQRVLDGMSSTLLPRLEAAQAQRMNALMVELRRSLVDQQEFMRSEVARLEGARPAGAVAGTPVTVPGTVPAAAAAPSPAAAVVWDDEAELLRLEIARAAAELEAARAASVLRSELGIVATRQPAFLATAETERGPAVVLADAAFTGDGMRVSEAARGAIGAVAELLLAHPERYVFVQAHADGTASELEGQRLSELRAETVRSLLVQAGVPADRIYAIGYGQGRPVASDGTAGDRALNRRVEIVVGGTAGDSAQY
jgi:outer membrane protein OmpA-like peptidoglycan-associated protein